LLQIAYRSAWAIDTFFAALGNEHIAENFELSAVSGLEKDRGVAVSALEEAIAYREAQLPYQPDKRKERIRGQIKTARGLLDDLKKGKVAYINSKELEGLGKEIRNIADAMVIHSVNTSHLEKINFGREHQLHIICEKPLVPVLDSNGNSSREELDELSWIVNSGNPGLLVDAEHYAYKPSSMMFYKNVMDLITSPIKRVVGEIMEIDHPNSPRTRQVLSRDNRTGLVTDTIGHLVSFVTNLGAEIVPTDVKFGYYPGYAVETYADAKYRVKALNNRFTKDATAELKVAKFIDKFKELRDVESKFIRFEFEKTDAEGRPDFVQVNLNNGGLVVRRNGVEAYVRDEVPANPNEYVNLLTRVNYAIRNGDPSAVPTNARNSLTTLDAMVKTYECFERNPQKVDVYRDPYAVGPVQISL